MDMTAWCEPTITTMIVKERPVTLYDIEVFPNCFHCTCKNSETKEILRFEISHRKNQLYELVDYFFTHRTEHVMCGYNNKHYDDIVINYLIYFYANMKTMGHRRICSSLYYLSKAIIDSEKDGNIERIKRYKYANYFYSFDLMLMLYSAKQQKSLKEIEILLHMDNVQEFSKSFDTFLEDEDLDEMIAYNQNDVEATETLFNRVKDEVQLRLTVEDKWGFDALSMSSVRFGEEILLQEYRKLNHSTKEELIAKSKKVNAIRLENIILPFIKYSNPKLKEILSDVKNAVCYTDKSNKKQKNYEKKFVLSNTCYSMGEGGIHTINSPRIYKPTGDEYIGHADVTSMYPSLAIVYNWTPSHLGKDFWNVYSTLYNERVTAKRNHEELKAKAFKYALNSPIGKMQQESSWAYDPLNAYRIRINGQLILLMLVDGLLSLGCKIVQVNTDGVVYIAKECNRASVEAAIYDIECTTQLKFETDDYESFYQYDVNSYFGVHKGFSQSGDPRLIEKKGKFITEIGLNNSMTPVVIAKAVIDYFLYEKPIDKSIMEDSNIRDFFMSQSVNKEFKVEYANKYVQRNNRYYASTNGYHLFRVKDRSYEKIKKDIIFSESGVTLANTIEDIPMKDRKVNYLYYIGKAQKLVNDFVCQQLTLFED